MIIFDDDVKQMINCAQRLEIAGECVAAQSLYKGIVQEVANRNGYDMISLFYGESVYDSINTKDDAINAIFIAKCAFNVYDAMNTTNPASSGTGAWAKIDGNRVDVSMRKFFEWLQKSRSKPTPDDSLHFKDAVRALSGTNTLYYKMSDVFMGYPLISIVQGIVDKSIKLGRDGELI